MRDVRLEHLLPVLWLVIGAPQQGAQRPAAALQAGMQLVYVSDGVEQDPWVVDSVWLDAALMDRRYMVFRTQRANGDTVRYATSGYAEELVSGIALRVLPTMIVTVDSLGRPKRRLEERYAIALVTATMGRFEVPDSSASAGWRTERDFALRA